MTISRCPPSFKVDRFGYSPHLPRAVHLFLSPLLYSIWREVAAKDSQVVSVSATAILVFRLSPLQRNFFFLVILVFLPLSLSLFFVYLDAPFSHLVCTLLGFRPGQRGPEGSICVGLSVSIFREVQWVKVGGGNGSVGLGEIYRTASPSHDDGGVYLIATTEDSTT